VTTQTIQIDPRHFEGVIGAALDRGAEAGLERVGLVIARDARDGAPVDTTSLRSSIMSNVTPRGLKTTVEVGPNVQSKEGAPYDIFQEFGTGIYGESPRSGWRKVSSVDGQTVGLKFKGRNVIRPRKKKFLSFTPKGGGGVIHRAWVRGVKPTRYMRNAVNRVNFEAEFIRGFDSTR